MTAGTLDLNGCSPTLSSLAGTGMVLNSGTASTVLTINVPSGMTSGNLTLGGSGVGSFSLVKTGNATLALGGTNAYTGGTTVLSGTLELLNSSALPSTGVLTIGSPRSVILMRARRPNVGLAHRLATIVGR